MAIEFRLLEDGEETAVLPDVESFSLSPILCDQGAIEFSYPRDGRNWELIADLDEFYVAVYIDGVRQGQLDALVKDVDGDDAEESSVWKFSGFFTTGRLAEAITYPKGWPSSVNTTDPNQTFSNVTVGTLIGTLLLQAHNRGTLTDIVATFTNTQDSNGVAWPGTFSIEYAPQVDYLTILKNLYVQGLVEFEIAQGELNLYVPDTLSVDRTTTEPPLVFRRGRDLTDSPRKRSTRDLGTVLLGAGADGLYLERVDAPGVASRRRIENGVSQGQVKDTGTLTAYTDAELARVKEAKMEKTHGLTFADPTSPRPIVNFNVGDWAYSDMGKGNERLRIKQWVLKLENSGVLSGSVTLNDFFAERNELLTRRIEGIIGGSTITGGSREVTPVPDDLVDGMPPAAPTGLSLASAAYMDAQGVTYAQVSASWLQVTTNQDGTILDDLDGYQLRWRYESNPTGWQVLIPNGEFASWSPVTPGVLIGVQVRSFDRAGNASAWAPALPSTVFTGVDATAPEVPAAPTVDNYLGLIRIRWNGGTASGAAAAPDQNGVEVHVSATNNFTPDATTRIDFLRTSGSSFYKGTYGVTYYVKLVAVDHTGNKSAASAQASASSTAVVSADVFDGAIGTAKLADLAVVTAKIADLAVNDAKIGSLSVGKLVSGTGTFDLVVAGRIATALAGQRAGIDSLGFFGYNATEQLTIRLDGLNNLLTGTFQTALSGRRVVIGAAGSTGRVNFIAPNGSQAWVQSFTSTTGGESIQMAVAGTGGDPPLSTVICDGTDNTFAIGKIVTAIVGGYTTGTRGFAVEYAPSKSDMNVNREALLNVLVDSGVTAYTTSTRDFAVRDRTSLQARFYIDGSGDNWYYGQHHNFYPKNSDVVNYGWMDVMVGASPSGYVDSFSIALLTPSNGPGGHYGGVIKYAVNDNLTNQGIEIRDHADSGYIPCRAFSFDAQSSRLGKKNIRNIDGTALEKVRTIRPAMFTRRQIGEQKRDLGGEIGEITFGAIAEVEELGLIAEDMPAEMQVPAMRPEEGPAVSLPAGLALALGGVAELIPLVEQLRAEVDELNKKGLK